MKCKIIQEKYLFFRLPVFILNHSINDLFHFLSEIGWIRRELLSRRPATLFLLFAVIVFVPATSAGGRGGGTDIHISLALAGGFLLTHLLFDLLQGTLFYGLQIRAAVSQPGTMKSKRDNSTL